MEVGLKKEIGTRMNPDFHLVPTFYMGTSSATLCVAELDSRRSIAAVGSTNNHLLRSSREPERRQKEG
jgi:hypothetical protein